MVGGRVGAGIAGPQQHGQGFPGTGGAVIDERAHRVKPVAPLIGRSG